MWLDFIKGGSIAILYAIALTYPMVVISHFIARKERKGAIVFAIGMIVPQLLWVFLGWLLFFSVNELCKGTEQILLLLSGSVFFLLAALVYHKQEYVHFQVTFNPSFLAALGTGFLMGFSFPMRMLGYFALLALLRLSPFPSLHSFISFLGGFIGGSLLFWASLMVLMYRRKEEMHPRTFQRLHKFVVFLFAALTGAALFQLYV